MNAGVRAALGIGPEGLRVPARPRRPTTPTARLDRGGPRQVHLRARTGARHPPGPTTGRTPAGVLSPTLAGGPSPGRRGHGPADALLRLGPAPDAVTIAVEDLRGHARGVPRVPHWPAGCGRFRPSGPGVKSGRPGGVRKRGDGSERRPSARTPPPVGDRLIGEAASSACTCPQGANPKGERALLVRVPEPGRSSTGSSGVSTTRGGRAGELVRESGPPAPRARRAPSASSGRARPTEWYAMLDDRAFAWSNSEELIQGAIDRQAGGGGRAWSSIPGVRPVRSGLPGAGAGQPVRRPAVRGAAAGRRRPETRDAGRGEGARACSRGTSPRSVTREWHGIAGRPDPHTEEVVDPAGITPGLTRWAGRTDRPTASLRRGTPTGLVMATAHVDFAALLDGLEAAIVPDGERPKADTG